MYIYRNEIVNWKATNVYVYMSIVIFYGQNILFLFFKYFSVFSKMNMYFSDKKHLFQKKKEKLTLNFP